MRAHSSWFADGHLPDLSSYSLSSVCAWGETERVRQGLFLFLFLFIFYFLNFFYFLAAPPGMWDLSSLTRNGIRAPWSGSVESQPLDRQGSPSSYFYKNTNPTG